MQSPPTCILPRIAGEDQRRGLELFEHFERLELIWVLMIDPIMLEFVFVYFNAKTGLR